MHFKNWLLVEIPLHWGRCEMKLLNIMNIGEKYKLFTYRYLDSVVFPFADWGKMQST